MTSLLQKINDLNVRVDNIDTTGGGGTTTANPIAMRVRYDGVSGSSVTVNGGNPLPYGAINFADGISYNTTTYKATILTAGKYFIGFSCYNVSNVSGAVDIRLNDTIVKGRFGERFTHVSIINGTTVLDLVENDTISIVCDNGSVRVLAVTSIPSFESSFFVMFRICSSGGSTIDSTTDISCNTLTTVGDISCGGIISAPNQISFRATRTNHVYINSNIALPFNVITYNVGGGYDNSTYTFTAPKTGTYFFYCVVFTDGNRNFTFDFLLNDTTILFRGSRPNTGGYVTNIPASFTTKLNSGDQVNIKRIQGTLYVAREPFTHWGGHFLG